MFFDGNLVNTTTSVNITTHQGRTFHICKNLTFSNCVTLDNRAGCFVIILQHAAPVIRDAENVYTPPSLYTGEWRCTAGPEE